MTRRAVTDEEIVERCVLALVNEAAKLLEDGIAQRDSDVDVVWVAGYNFPAYRGGPLFWAQQRAGRVVARMRSSGDAGEYWRPQDLLARRGAGATMVGEFTARPSVPIARLDRGSSSVFEISTRNSTVGGRCAAVSRPSSRWRIVILNPLILRRSRTPRASSGRRRRPQPGRGRGGDSLVSGSSRSSWGWWATSPWRCRPAWACPPC